MGIGGRVAMDWWEYIIEVITEVKRAVLASFTDEEKTKMTSDMGSDEEIQAQLALYAMIGTISLHFSLSSLVFSWLDFAEIRVSIACRSVCWVVGRGVDLV